MIYELRLENRMALQNLLEYSGWIGMSAVQTFSTSRMHFCVCSTNWDDIRVSSPTNTEPQIDTMISATRRDIRCADSGLEAKWSFRHFFTSDYCSWISIFYGFLTFLLVATFLGSDYHSITSTCEPGLSMDFSFLGTLGYEMGLLGFL